MGTTLGAACGHILTASRMESGVMDPTARILRLLSLLQTYRHWPGDELSDRLGVSPRTLRRDVDRLRELGYPVDATPRRRRRLPARRPAPGCRRCCWTTRRRWRSRSGCARRPAAGSTGIEETSLRALAKLRAGAAARLRRRVDALADATETTVFSGRAADDPERSRWSRSRRPAAAGSGCGSATRRRTDRDRRRLVEPHRLVARGRRWYLVAWDLRARRLADVPGRPARRARSPTGVRFTPRELPAEDAAAYVTQALRTSRAATRRCSPSRCRSPRPRSRSRAGSAS